LGCEGKKSSPKWEGPFAKKGLYVLSEKLAAKKGRGWRPEEKEKSFRPVEDPRSKRNTLEKRFKKKKKEGSSSGGGNARGCLLLVWEPKGRRETEKKT